MGNIYEQIDFTNHMEPIIRAYHAAMEAQFEGEVLKACQRVGIEVDKERLVQALTDARKFYDEGYRAGYGDGYREGLMIALGGGYGPMRGGDD